MPRFVKVSTVGDPQPGTGKVIEVEERILALFNVGGQYFCIDNACPHQLGPLGEGYLQDDVVSCPWHGWQFNVKTGCSSFAPDLGVPAYKCRVEGNEVQVDLEVKGAAARG